MKWIVITAKHHDGFCMFNTKLTDYNIVKATPFKRDPLKELAGACKKANIKFGFYYSQTLDWHHPDGMGNDWDYDPKEKHFSRYLREYVKPQLKELLSNYGPIAVIWFDIKTPTPEQARELRNLVRSYQKNTIISGRIRGGISAPTGILRQGIGDYASAHDNQIPTGSIVGDWETPATINDTWGYKSYDQNWKSVGNLIQKLVEIVSKGGNYLLNVGPTAEGQIPEPSIQRLTGVGEWLKNNGESIYNTSAIQIESHPASPYRFTSTTNKLYLHVLAWPWNNRLEIGTGKIQVKKVYLFSDHRELEFEQSAECLHLIVPKRAPDPIDTVIILETS
jgi:alpha-L-fucosidase